MKEQIAVLSVDSDRNEFFRKRDRELWVNDLSGLLSELALAEFMDKNS